MPHPSLHVRTVGVLCTLLFIPFLLPARSEKLTSAEALRQSPAAESPVLVTLAAGTTVEILESGAEWSRVEVPGETPRSGYIRTAALGGAPTQAAPPPAQAAVQPVRPVKDRIFLMGMGMLRLNWASVRGNEIRFRYSDLGLPTELSTRERASFMVDGTLGHGRYKIDGHLDYDPENRITEPPLEFLLHVGNDKLSLTAGDNRTGVLANTIFTQYYHPFRGLVLGAATKWLRMEVLGGLSRGESGLDRLPADAGSGPYYLNDAPLLRGSEMIYLVTSNAAMPDQELKRTLLVRNRDYYIDYDRGSLLFTYSLYPYDEMGNPVSILAQYQFETLAGRFSRAVYGFRAAVTPWRHTDFSLSYIADADKNLPLGDMFKDPRSILSLGVHVNSARLSAIGEVSWGSDPASAKRRAVFGGGTWKILPRLRLLFHLWSVDDNFPTFANKQLQYGYSLFQIYPESAERTIFLSPFQFTRNLSAELYPFSQARLSVDEREGHGALEWEIPIGKAPLRLSAGAGSAEEPGLKKTTDTYYLSAFHDGEATKAWGKVGLERQRDVAPQASQGRVLDTLAGFRQRLHRFSGGDLFVQADVQHNRFDDLRDLTADTRRLSMSFLCEFLTASEGFFAAYRRETLDEKGGQSIGENSIFEIGGRRHLFRKFFGETRFRRENTSRNGVDSDADILSLGAGYESPQFRVLGRYEIQTRDSDGNDGRRRLWSLFLYGAPVKRMSVSLQYYHQLGRSEGGASLLPGLTEQSEEQLSLRFLWRPLDKLNLYSQWRYDTNLEQLPPLDRTRSNSLAAVHGLKWQFLRKFEFLANYKLLKIWGPIENRKYTAAAELGYLLLRHFRIGLGAEYIDFHDPAHLDAEYRSTVGYFKLVALF